MKRIAASLLLTVILLGTYFLITISVRRYFLFGPGPFTIGKVATEYIVPRSGSNARTYDENKALVVFFSVSFISVAVPFYVLLLLLKFPQRTRFDLP